MPRFTLNDGAVAQEDVDDEVIAIHFQTGAYYSMRDSAATIWRLAIGGVDRTAIVDLAAADAALRGDIERFLDDCVAFDLLRADPAEGVPLPASVATPIAPPVLDKFEDMAEFIKLDPIHEVSTQGWPYVQQ